MLLLPLKRLSLRITRATSKQIRPTVLWMFDAFGLYLRLRGLAAGSEGGFQGKARRIIEAGQWTHENQQVLFLEIEELVKVEGTEIVTEDARAHEPDQGDWEQIDALMQQVRLEIGV